MTSYTFKVELEPDGDGWRAFYTPLEHLGASTWGSTPEEATKNIQEVLDLILEELIEEGAEITGSEDVMVTEGTAVTVTR